MTMHLPALLIASLIFAAWGKAASLPPLILISLDGFRWDYTELFPAESRTLRTLQREGVMARGLVPVFPSNTFPNHYTLVTGLYPARHGIVNNDFFDPESGGFFRYNQPAIVADAKWWGGEPIWVTAIKQGRKAAASFWVGSEAVIGGVRPTFWRNYDGSVPFEKRLDEVARWMALPDGERPDLIVLYLEDANGAGHQHGPASPEVATAIRRLDARIATLLECVRNAGHEPNVIIVSDHGMTATSPQRVIHLEDHLDVKTVQVDADGSVAALRPLDGDVEKVMRALRHVPHATAYRVEDLPAHFNFRGSPRIAPIWVLPEEGWHLVRRTTFERLKARYAYAGYLPGDHGYDPKIKNMHGVLVAHGPAFRRGAVLPEVENIHVYNLMCAVLKLKPAPNDGDERLVQAALVE